MEINDDYNNEINDDKLERGRHIDYQECIQPFQVSDTLTILWDRQSCGPPSDITICPYKNLVVLIRDKALGIGWNVLENKKQMAMTLNLIGSINLDSKALDGRFDILLQYLKENEDEQLLACDIITPIKFAKKNEFSMDVTEEEFLSDLNAISYACHSEFSVELSRFIKMRIICQIQGPNCLIMIKMMTAGMEFFAVPIPQIPILNTALSNRLLNSESEMCTGFVSMNKSRKLVMLLENDPKVFNFPLVGIWVSGTSTVFHSFVWASCLRYINCSKYSERFCLPPQPFLLVLYSTLYCNPEFYDCTTKSGTCELSYDLYEGSAKTTLARVPMIDTKVTKVELFKVADKKKCKLFINAEQQIKEMKLENNMSCININDMPQTCPHPQQLKIINPQPVVPDLSMSDSRNQQNKDIHFSCTTNFTNKEMTISDYLLKNENKTSQNSVRNTLLEKMQKCTPSNCFNTEKDNPICSQETSSRKCLIGIKQFPSIINEYDDKIKSVTNKNNISNSRQTIRQQRKNELLNGKTKTKEQFNQNAIPDDIYKLLQHQEKQLQLLQQQIKLLREQNENLTREAKCTKQAPLISVATMTSMDSKNENQSFHKKKVLKNEEIQTEAIQTNLCNKSNIRVGEKTNHSYMDRCCFPNNCNSKASGEFTEFSLEEFRLDTFSENHDNSFPSILVDVPDYHTSVHSSCSNEEGLTLGESASTKGNQSDSNEISVQVPDKENGNNTKREFDNLERTNQLYLIPEVSKNENASKKILYENFLDNINRFLVQTPNAELPISKKVLNSFQNWTAEVSLLSPEICWELEHLPKLSYPYTEISLSMATNALTLKYLGDDQLTKTFPPPENLSRSSDLTPYGLSPSNVSFATKRYLERHGLVTIGNFALERETEDKCKY